MCLRSGDCGVASDSMVKDSSPNDVFSFSSASTYCFRTRSSLSSMGSGLVFSFRALTTASSSSLKGLDPFALFEPGDFMSTPVDFGSELGSLDVSGTMVILGCFGFIS